MVLMAIAQLDHGPVGTEMMLMIAYRDSQSAIAKRDHWSIELAAHTHLRA
jgi:hypothetical protein